VNRPQNSEYQMHRLQSERSRRFSKTAIEPVWPTRAGLAKTWKCFSRS
jgi:hypothetical protein